MSPLYHYDIFRANPHYGSVTSALLNWPSNEYQNFLLSWENVIRTATKYISSRLDINLKVGSLHILKIKIFGFGYDFLDNYYLLKNEEYLTCITQ